MQKASNFRKQKHIAKSKSKVRRFSSFNPQKTKANRTSKSLSKFRKSKKAIDQPKHFYKKSPQRKQLGNRFKTWQPTKSNVKSKSKHPHINSRRDQFTKKNTPLHLKRSKSSKKPDKTSNQPLNASNNCNGNNLNNIQLLTIAKMLNPHLNACYLSPYNGIFYPKTLSETLYQNIEEQQCDLPNAAMLNTFNDFHLLTEVNKKLSSLLEPEVLFEEIGEELPVEQPIKSNKANQTQVNKAQVNKAQVNQTQVNQNKKKKKVTIRKNSKRRLMKNDAVRVVDCHLEAVVNNKNLNKNQKYLKQQYRSFLLTEGFKKGQCNTPAVRRRCGAWNRNNNAAEDDDEEVTDRTEDAAETEVPCSSLQQDQTTNLNPITASSESLFLSSSQNCTSSNTNVIASRNESNGRKCVAFKERLEVDNSNVTNNAIATPSLYDQTLNTNVS